MSETTVTGKVTFVKRLTNTASGNPRWSLRLGKEGSFRTADDVADAYGITPDWVGREVTLELDSYSRIVRIKTTGAKVAELVEYWLNARADDIEAGSHE